MEAMPAHLGKSSAVGGLLKVDTDIHLAPQLPRTCLLCNEIYTAIGLCCTIPSLPQMCRNILTFARTSESMQSPLCTVSENGLPAWRIEALSPAVRPQKVDLHGYRNEA